MCSAPAVCVRVFVRVCVWGRGTADIVALPAKRRRWLRLRQQLWLCMGRHLGIERVNFACIRSRTHWRSQRGRGTHALSKNSAHAGVSAIASSHRLPLPLPLALPFVPPTSLECCRCRCSCSLLHMWKLSKKWKLWKCEAYAKLKYSLAAQRSGAWGATAAHTRISRHLFLAIWMFLNSSAMWIFIVHIHTYIQHRAGCACSRRGNGGGYTHTHKNECQFSLRFILFSSFFVLFSFPSFFSNICSGGKHNWTFSQLTLQCIWSLFVFIYFTILLYYIFLYLLFFIYYFFYFFLFIIYYSSFAGAHNVCTHCSFASPALSSFSLVEARLGCLLVGYV